MIRLFVLVLVLPMAAAALENPLSRLQIVAQHARYTGDCADTAVIEHAQSLSIPVKTAKGLRFRQMYYPAIALKGALDKSVYPPSSVAQFDGAGRDVTCREAVKLPKADFKESMGAQSSPQVTRMTWADYQAASAKYYVALERVAKAFDAGKKDAPAREAAAEFQALFETLSEPGLKAHYRALSPDFWAWLEALKKK